ncbi:uncharacterized protein LOC129199870 [Grus americana]|uniref:uncharacterized protein LOC129199870 n=1 Tax=Grus americana TaxID=9117 RepID=UPI0024080EC9|nr:uncharacterized protein LOC129199870 [Grus americana]XP_054666928.1 uncharacterized protein LOC129199870 [Grus americana]
MLVAVVTHADTDTLFTLTSKGEVTPSFMVPQGNDITIRCRLITESRIEPINSYEIGPHGPILCKNQNLDCWLNLTAVQYSHKVICGKNNTKYWGQLKIDVIIPTTQPIVALNSKIFEIGPYVIRNTGLQQMLFNPAWSLKRVELSMRNNVSNIQPACSPFLKISYERWTTWLQKRTLTMKRTWRDLTGVSGTGLGVLNSIDSEVIMNKLAASVSDLAKLQQPLRSSLLALRTNQWLLSNILPTWERINIRDHKLVTDVLGVVQNNLSLALSCIQAQLWMQSVAASIIREGEEGTLPTEIRKIVWDSATDFEKELQSWWSLVNFTYDPVTNTATTFVLTISNATIYSIYPIVALGLNHNGTILYPSEHRVWARKMNEKWQTVNLESYIVREQQGFVCEDNAIETQDICLDSEQNICHFEVHPNENPKTVIIYIGKGCICLRTICDSLYVDKIVVEIKNHSNFCVCNFTKIDGCDFSYSTPVTSHQLLQSNYMMIHELLPVPIGMNLTLVKQLLQHKDLIAILKKIRENGQNTLITVHHNVKEIHRVFERAQRDAELRWWDTLFGWSPTATGILNKLCHPIVILLILVLISLILSAILYVIAWKMINRLTYLKKQITREATFTHMIVQDVAKQQKRQTIPEFPPT